MKVLSNIRIFFNYFETTLNVLTKKNDSTPRNCFLNTQNDQPLDSKYKTFILFGDVSRLLEHLILGLSSFSAFVKVRVSLFGDGLKKNCL